VLFYFFGALLKKQNKPKKFAANSRRGTENKKKGKNHPANVRQGSE